MGLVLVVCWHKKVGLRLRLEELLPQYIVLLLDWIHTQRRTRKILDALAQRMDPRWRSRTFFRTTDGESRISDIYVRTHMYVDGHEYDSIQEYRQKFFPFMLKKI